MSRYTSSSSSSTSHLRSPSRPPRSSRSTDSQRRSSLGHSDKDKNVLKTSLAFLGVVGAVSIAASKYWPKGILYGEKESWAREAKEAKEEVKHAIGGHRSDDRKSRTRPPSARHHHPSTRRRPPVQTEIRDEMFVRKPDGRTMYVDTGFVPRVDDDRSPQGREQSSDTKDSKSFDNDPSKPEELKIRQAPKGSPPSQWKKKEQNALYGRESTYGT
ncbi:hypothetical protein M426DRAFT_27603 [Hypoxylon sp. CI-4A]|nr:hypothetical protein M426DRAFT_27603 [Hypoxylon sp. CI-4A]